MNWALQPVTGSGAITKGEWANRRTNNSVIDGAERIAGTRWPCWPFCVCLFRGIKTRHAGEEGHETRWVEEKEAERNRAVLWSEGFAFGEGKYRWVREATEFGCGSHCYLVGSKPHYIVCMMALVELVVEV